jgi:hypothetical protein
VVVLRHEQVSVLEMVAEHDLVDVVLKVVETSE